LEWAHPGPFLQAHKYRLLVVTTEYGASHMGPAGIGWAKIIPTWNPASMDYPGASPLRSDNQSVPIFSTNP